MRSVPHVRPVDFSLHDEGSISILFPLTAGAVRWIADNLPPDAMTWCGGTVIEHRFVAPVVAGILDDGLEVR
jgi:hypothetical protein